MSSAEHIKITVENIEDSRLPQVDFSNLKFGQFMSDHMLVANFDNGKWENVKIVPYGDLSISPSMSALHYGQAIFEGIKAYKFPDGRVSIFRPDKNWERFNRSASRLCMPEVPQEIFLDGLKQLLSLDKDWVPNQEGTALYIRPFMFATEAALGVHPSKSYTFAIITCPVGAYYSKPISLKVETNYVRASEGGVGFSKNAGNYALSLYPTQLANNQGYDQIMWTDAKEHRFIEEAGTANLIFRIGDSIITPHRSDERRVGHECEFHVTGVQTCALPISNYVCASEGGVGFSKNAGNYALSLYPTQLANNQGYDQIMWTDAKEHRFIEEAGTANLIFRIGDSIITPH